MQECYISKIGINKKTNKLTIILNTDKFVQIKDMWDFEKYLMERFQIKDIEIVSINFIVINQYITIKLKMIMRKK